MKPLTIEARLRIVGWETVVVGALWATLQLLAAAHSTWAQTVERFTVDGGAGIIGLTLILVGMESLALTGRLGVGSGPQPITRSG